jgi:hypothetical protein
MDLMQSDLKKSGLEPRDMRVRPIDDMERTACAINPGIEGYAIPYFNLKGVALPFYRSRLFNSDPKYKQPKNTANHVYFPPNFLQTLKASKQNVVCLVEGEKKAACLNNMGLATVGFGGVDSWRNRSLILPKDTEFKKFNYGQDVIKADIPAGQEAADFNLSGYAVGFEDLMEYALSQKLSLMIIYDSDKLYGVKPEVQRAAATLGYELRHRGFTMPQIKQLVLPCLDEEKTGVDDFLYHADGGLEKFKNLFQQVMNNPRAFPSHPNVRSHVTKKLQRSKISRKDMQALSLALIAEMDTHGYRMHSIGEGRMYYFDNQTARLMPVDINKTNMAGIQETPFGKLLYQNYGISPAADSRLIQWLGAQFAGEDPISHVNPHRVLARPDSYEDCVRFQISDGQYVQISADGIDIKKNGDDGILFEAGRVAPVDIKSLQAEIVKQRKAPLKMWWEEVFSQSRIKDRGTHQTLMALLYYTSPWLYRWRNTQLPVELVIGEPGSGKSTLLELRLMMQTGGADLKNAPGDIRDWHAALSNSGGLHVTDNVQLLNKGLRTMLSDEICRLITEPAPHIEMRKLYTDADLAKIKVDNVFVFTAVSQPFMASDLLQRAVIVEFDKSQDKNLVYDSNWKDRKLAEYGGREAWLAHHFVVLEKFFQAVREYWDPRYHAKHRLVNFEQILLIMAEKVFGIDGSWIQGKLSQDVVKTVAANDWALEGLSAFTRATVRLQSTKEYTTKDIAEWARTHPDFQECAILINSRKLGIYLSTHKHMIHQITGLQEQGKSANRIIYSIDKAIVLAGEV